MKSTFLTLIFVSLISFAAAQEIVWQNTIGGSNMDELYSVIQTTDGGFLLGGQSNSNISGDKTENSFSNNFDYWIVKTDGAGNIQWQNTIGGVYNDKLKAVVQTTDGGYILGGSSRSLVSGDKTEPCLGQADIWIVKIDSVGNILWQNTIGAGGNDGVNCLQQTADGGFILGGFSDSWAAADKSENSIGLVDFWIVKTDAAGNVQWENTIGGYGSEYITAMDQTDDGGYTFLGYSDSNQSGDKGEDCIGGNDIWIVKTDSAGVVIWDNTIGGSGEDIPYSIQQEMDGGFWIGGGSNSNISGDKATDSKGGHDFWEIKTDSISVIEWQLTIGGNQYEWPGIRYPTTDGGHIMAGHSISDVSGDKSEPCLGGDDFWVVKTNNNGAIEWQNTIGGTHNDHVTAVLQTSEGDYVVAGYSFSNFGGDKTENSNGGYDYWIVRLTNRYNLVQGKLFLDLNSNNIHDQGEPPFPNKVVMDITTGRLDFSDNNGNYIIPLLDTGLFTIAPDQLNYYTASPSSYQVNFTGFLQIDSLNDFALQPAGIFNDVCASINPTGLFRAGFDAHYVLSYSNVGTTNISPTVIFYPDTSVAFVSASPAPTSVTPDSVVWSIANLTPFQTGSINVTVNVNIGTPIGTLINSGVVIEPIAGDANTQCNQSYWEIFTTGSSDPNDILVDQDTLLSTQFPSPPYLEYLIRFQNTGNDTAFTVKVLNPIDTFNLDLSTFEFVASSHPTNISWIPWERNLQFQFDNILLPDSNVNEATSHGFIRYRIKSRSTLIAGDSINNYAAIYFDFNAPVITNTAVTEVVVPVGIHEVLSGNHLTVFPNPATDRIRLAAGSWQQTATFEVLNMLGTVVLNGRLLNDAEATIKIGALTAGIYQIRIQEDRKGAIHYGRFVKM